MTPNQKVAAIIFQQTVLTASDSGNVYLIDLVQQIGAIREATGFTPSTSVTSAALVEVSEQSTNTAATATDLSIGARTATSIEIESSTGANTQIESVTDSAAGLASAADKVKLGRLAEV